MEKAFLLFMDATWPTWCYPENQGSVLYHQYKKAFEAGWQASAKNSPFALLAVEFGYKQCEKGNNVQAALANAQKVLAGEAP